MKKKAGSIARPTIGGMPTAGRMLPISGGVIKVKDKKGTTTNSKGDGGGLGFSHHKETPEGLGHGTRHDMKHQAVGFKKKKKG